MLSMICIDRGRDVIKQLRGQYLEASVKKRYMQGFGVSKLRIT
jgi:hypothetical protein